MSNILIVEDDNDINQLLQMILKKEGFQVMSAFSGTEGKLLFELEEIQLVICDLMLPGMNGEDLIQQIRNKSNVPIVVLTAKGGLEDKVKVFEVGADDYITKPFEPKELLARVKAQLRRMSGFGRENPEGADKFQEYIEDVESSVTSTVANTVECYTEKEGSANKVLRFKELVMNVDSMTVEVEGYRVELTQREFQILQTMLITPKKVYSKEALYEAVWKQGYYGEDNTISMHISNIRKKIEVVTKEEYISTVWGIGYKLNL